MTLLDRLAIHLMRSRKGEPCYDDSEFVSAEVLDHRDRMARDPGYALATVEREVHEALSQFVLEGRLP